MRNIIACIPLLFIIGCGEPQMSCQDVYEGIEEELYTKNSKLGKEYYMNLVQDTCNSYSIDKTVNGDFNTLYSIVLDCHQKVKDGKFKYSFSKQTISTTMEDSENKTYSCLVQNFHTDVTVDGIKIDIPDATLQYSYQEFVDGTGYYRTIDTFERND